MTKTITGLFVLLAAAGGGTACRGKQEPAKAATATTDSAADEASRRDHEIGITNLQVKAAGGAEFELTVDVHDPKGDLAPQEKAVAKYQIVCPGGSAHAVLSEPTRIEATAEGRTIARHRVDLGQVKRGTDPCRIRLAIGHRYDFLSNELEGVLAP